MHLDERAKGCRHDSCEPAPTLVAENAASYAIRRHWQQEGWQCAEAGQCGEPFELHVVESEGSE